MILTIVLSVFVLVSLTLVLAGPEIAEHIAARVGLGPVFAWTWKILQWPVAFLLISEGFGLVYYLAPDAEQRWPWILPGAHIATLLWLAISDRVPFLHSEFRPLQQDVRVDWRGHRAAVVVLPSGLVLLFGAELNSEIEHASPYGKAEGEKVPGERRRWMFRSRHTTLGETPR